jgi:hypothetical protein
MIHHFLALVVVTCTVLGIPVPRFTLLVERSLSIGMRSINSQKVPTPSLHQGICCIIEPSDDKIAVEAIALANLAGRQHARFGRSKF